MVEMSKQLKLGGGYAEYIAEREAERKMERDQRAQKILQERWEERKDYDDPIECECGSDSFHVIHHDGYEQEWTIGKCNKCGRFVEVYYRDH
jgi:hypothetical protein